MTVEKSAAEIAAENNRPGHYHPQPAVAAATQFAIASAPVQAAKPITHVLVPVATLQAMHATLSSHADAILALLPATTPEQVDEALRLMTASRLKQQTAAGK